MRAGDGWAIGARVEDWTIRRVVTWTSDDFAARGLDSPRLDAELLVSEALSLDRVRLYMDLDRPLGTEELEAIRALVKRRRAREPVAYILGRRDFYGRTFHVSAAVLVPRPETETLVERALAILAEDEPAVRVLDLCTGSGAIGLTLAAEQGGLRVDLTDVSAPALAVAAQNAESLGVQENVRFFEGDLFGAIPEGERYRLIACNPPYVPESDAPELAPEILAHEPRGAVISGPSGFEVHRRLVEGAGDFLEPGGTILVEVGQGQAAELAALFLAAPWCEETAIHDDLSRVARVVEARAHGAPDTAPGPAVSSQES